MLKKMTFAILCYFIASSIAFAQGKQVSGVVISSEDNQPVIGASVVVTGTATGTVTDFDGRFSFEAPASAKTLTISYVGMETQTLNVGTNLRVVLNSDTEQLDEVMVVAYGTAKKSSFTGSASTVSGEKIQKMQVSNVSKALEGSTAGVQISSGSGQPGSSAEIHVRGLGSISAGKSALIVLDGVPFEGSLNQIAPSDIESMTVLKDAAANSLYGARGSNGVVLITTKKGKEGKSKVTFENRTGVNTRGISSYDLLESPQEYYELFWEGLRNQSYYSAGNSYLGAGQYASTNLIDKLGGSGYNNYDVADNELVDPVTGRLNPNANLLYHDDWLKEALRPGLRQENTLSISGGTDKTSYYASVGYLYDDSYTVQSDFDRINARVKLDQQVNDWFKAGVNIAFSNTKSNSPDVGGTNYSSIFYFGQSVAPIYPVYMYDRQGDRIKDANGKDRYDYGVEMGKRPIGANANPIDQQINNIYRSSTDALNARAYAEIKFSKDLTLMINGSIDNFNSRGVEFQTPIGGDALNVNGRSYVTNTRTNVMNFNQLLNYSRTMGNSGIEILLGHETKKDRYEYLTAMKENFLIPDNPELSNAAGAPVATSYNQEYSLEGFFGQIKYDYAQKYYLSGSFRRDGSSKFHEDNRWGNFWSVGASWRINKEAIMQGTESWLDDLKLKASYGTQGNDAIGNNQPYLDQYEVVSNSGQIGVNYIFRGNPEITWEKSNNFNVGVDFRICNRLSGNVEYFDKTTYDLLYAKPLPPSQGLPGSIWENTMKMRNKGIEVELQYNILRDTDLKWNIGLNATRYTNELLELPADRPQDGWAVGSYYRRIGESIYSYYDYKYAGVDPENGDALYWADKEDEDGNVIGQEKVVGTNSATRYELGKSPIPELYGGFNTSLDYKGIDLGLNFAYQLGGWAYDSVYRGFMHSGTAGDNWHKDVYDRWTPDNRYTNIPRLEEGSQDQSMSGDACLTKASYLSLRNATLGYTFPSSLMRKANIDRLRLYVTGDNLFLLSCRKGFDPRQSFTGSTGYAYSAVRTISFGINLEF